MCIRIFNVIARVGFLTDDFDYNYCKILALLSMKTYARVTPDEKTTS